MVLDVGWDVILLAGDVLGARNMLPDVKIGVEKFFSLSDSRIELNPLGTQKVRICGINKLGFWV